MAYDQALAQRIRPGFPAGVVFTEKSMFGGLCFLVGGKMCCGIVGRELMVRVGPQRHEEALALPHARPMDFTGRPMRGFAYVAPEGFKTRPALVAWIERGLAGMAQAKTKALKATTSGVR